MNDSWKYRKEAVLKTIAVSCGMVTRYPWEVLAYGDGPIEGVAVHSKLPDKLIKQMDGATAERLELDGCAGRVRHSGRDDPAAQEVL